MLVLLFSAGMASASPWGEVKRPSSGPPRVIGGVSNGCIAGALALPESGPGYVSIRRYRNRYYGHPKLLRFIADMGLAQKRHGDRLMMIGDLSQPRGGLMSSSHRSHQNGLDVDIWLTLADSPAMARRLMDDRSDPDSMVAPGGDDISRYWGEDQRFLIETAARHPSVDRIFANPAIKQALCRSARGDRSWLRKVRPWWGHDAHIHVRLSCPPGSGQCASQSPVPVGEGCGKELAWWFSPEARKPSKKGGRRVEPTPPAACSALLRDM
ncbi:penicillin-insensitive murein endopeptidase [Imhoffiella purpurea]|uniref:Murein endopeptidase n=1 Tax=Imhoffiella purpurea TaxID=1249627 RepID=W9V2N0_9GAMM|nr:penicillin-insensitive murein endopeptidase [Imhoffiella purpurea]EXJ13758.1 Murein endopeptidase [Imhoffiella purpurea]